MKKIISVLLILSLSLFLYACGGNTGSGDETEDVSIALAIADKIKESVVFEDDMALNQFPMDTLGRYEVDEKNVKDVAWYVGSGAVADELVVVECPDAASVEVLKNAFAGRIEYLNKSYSDYAPAQVPRIEKAKVLVYDNTVIYCICADSDNFQAICDSVMAEQ